MVTTIQIRMALAMESATRKARLSHREWDFLRVGSVFGFGWDIPCGTSFA